MTVTAIFADGYMVSAEGWVELEDKLRADPWNPPKLQAYREEMAWRAANWSNTTVREGKSSEAFLRALEMAGLMRLEESR